MTTHDIWTPAKEAAIADAADHAAYLDECSRYLEFITSARQREDRAYAEWERPTDNPRHHADACTDYLRAYDEVNYLRERLRRLQARHIATCALCTTDTKHGRM